MKKQITIKRKVANKGDKKLYAIKVVTRRQRLALELLSDGEERLMGHWGNTVEALCEKGLVRCVRQGWYVLTVAGKRYIALTRPWLVNNK